MTDTRLHTDAAVAVLNPELTKLTAEQRLRWGQAHSQRIAALCSGGNDSAIIVHLMRQILPDAPIIHIVTGRQKPEVSAYMALLEKTYCFEAHRFGPSEAELQLITEGQLQEYDIDLYRKLTKRDPLSRAIRELGIDIIVTGARAYQTQQRAGKGVLQLGHDGELQLQPTVDWNEQQVADFKRDNQLPTHSLPAGVSVDDEGLNDMAKDGRGVRRYNTCSLLGGESSS